MARERGKLCEDKSVGVCPLATPVTLLLSDMTRRGVKINTESLVKKDKEHIVVKSHLVGCCCEVVYAWKGAVMRSLGRV